MGDGYDLLDALGAGVLVVGTDGQIEYANLGAGAILRRPVAQITGRPLGDVLLPIDALPTNGERRELTVRLPSGAATVIGLSARGSTTGTRTLLFEEITDILELRRQRDRLLQMAALGDALPSMLHELRNPLAAITSMLEVLVEDASTAEGLRDDLHTVLWEVRRMGLTLQGVGSLAHSVHTARLVAVDHAVEEAVRVLIPTAERKGISLRTEVATMPLLPLDWGVISGVVFNLTRNAIDACRAGDRIVVSSELMPGVAAGATFLLRVADSGPGMTSDVLGRCCELFFTSKENGSGVGLALCKQIAESSGGNLNIASSLGTGTTVTVDIPIHEFIAL
jgi:signal transduction histidine kinase